MYHKGEKTYLCLLLIIKLQENNGEEKKITKGAPQ